MSQYTRFPDPAGGIKIYPSVTDFPADPGRDGVQAVAADTNTIYIYDTSIPGWAPVANPGAAIAIDGLMADVSATGPGVVNATVNSVGGASAADVATSVSDTQAATNAATPNTLVKRDLNSQITLKALNLDGATSGTINIYPAAVTTNYTVNLPGAQGAASSVLQNDGAGNLSWTNLVTGVSNVTASAPLSSSGGATPNITISQSSAISNGYLSSADWSTFNSKQNALTFGNLTEATSSILTISGGTGAVIGTGTSIQVSQAGVASSGYLSQADWNTFNNKVTSVSGSAPISSSGGTTPTISVSDFGGATSLLPGSRGTVPAPAAGDQTKYLRGDATWQTISLLPAYSQDKVLYSTASAAEWKTVGTGSTDSSYPANTVILGQAKPASLSGTGNFLAGTSAGVNLSSGYSNIVIGFSAGASLTTNSNGYQSVVIGNTADAPGRNAVAVGYGASAAIGGVAVGQGAASGNNSIAIGAGATAGNGIAIGGSSKGDNGNVSLAGGTYNSLATSSTFIRGDNTVVSGTKKIFFGSRYRFLDANITEAYWGQGGYGSDGNAYLQDFRMTVTPVLGMTNESATNGTFTISGAQSTGTGVGGDIIFNASPAGASGSTANAYVEMLRVSANKFVKISVGEKHASLHGQTGTANVITAAVNNYYIGVDSTLAAKTVNLPAAATAGQGFVLVIKDESGTAGTNNITLQANGAETIDGANTKLIAANYGSYSLMCSGSAWFIM